MTCNQTAGLLSRMDDILIITHRRPDGDAVGCGAALCIALKALGKTAWILENPEITERFASYIEGLTAPAAFEPKCVVTVDTASEGMFCLGAEVYYGKVDLCIDHHASNQGYAAHSWLNPAAAACGEMVLDLVIALCGGLPPDCGPALYLAISTDTGCFKYSNTTATTLRAAAWLKDAGVDTYAINKVMFGTKSLSRLKLESLLVEGLETYAGGRVAVMCLTRAMMAATGATDNDIDDISGFPRVVEGAEVGVLVRELTDNTSKCSVRSAGKANASAICAVLGGGGHPGAAGVSLDVPYTEMKRLILDSVAQAGFPL